jgi:cytochrome c peroxidase
MKLFFSERLRCAECHTGFALAGPTVYDGSKAESLVFHNTGLYNLGGSGAYPAASRGLFDATRRPSDMGRFRAPTLRNIALTAPYMHDGSIGTLDEVIGHYAAGGRTLKGERAGVGRNNPFKSPEVAGFTLRGTERADLVAFLESLTDRLFVTNPAFGPP